MTAQHAPYGGKARKLPRFLLVGLLLLHFSLSSISIPGDVLCVNDFGHLAIESQHDLTTCCGVVPDEAKGVDTVQLLTGSGPYDCQDCTDIPIIIHSIVSLQAQKLDSAPPSSLSLASNGVSYKFNTDDFSSRRFPLDASFPNTTALHSRFVVLLI
jgi:hypothetical protein